MIATIATGRHGAPRRNALDQVSDASAERARFRATAAAEHLSPALPRARRRAAPPTSCAPGRRRRSTATSSTSTATSWSSATPGAGKTDLRAPARQRAAAAPRRRPRHRGRADRAPEDAVGRRRAPGGHPARSAVQQQARRASRGSSTGSSSPTRRSPCGRAAPRADRVEAHAGHPRRGAPRRRRAQLGRRDPRGVRGRRRAGSRSPARRSAATPRPSRSCTYLRNEQRHPAVADRLRVRLRARAARRRRAAGHLPVVRRLDALAHPAGRGVGGDARPGRHQRRHRAGLASGARSRRRLDPGGARRGRSAAERGAAGGPGCRRAS